MIENIVVTLDSLEYPVDFIILSPKVNLAGYPVILGRPWLATNDANINCRSGNMTISNGQATKQFDLYPPAQLLTDLSTSLWPDLGDEEEEINSIVQLMMLHRQSFLKLQEEDSVIQSILTNTCIVGKDVSESSVLELITYECDTSCTLLKELENLCSLLPCELEGSPISKIVMVESTIPVELSKGHKLHVNPQLTFVQMKQLKELLQKHEKNFS